MASLMLRAIPIPMASRPITFSSPILRSEFIPSSLPIDRVSVSAASSSSTYPTISCGRGDRRTAKGKRFAHSFGNARPRNKKSGRGPPRVHPPPAPPRKDEFDQLEILTDEDFEGLEE